MVSLVRPSIKVTVYSAGLGGSSFFSYCAVTVRSAVTLEKSLSQPLKV